MSQLLATLRSRRQPRRPVTVAPVPAADTVTVAALRVRHLATPPGAPDLRAPSTDRDAIEDARHRLEEGWRAGTPVDELRAELVRAGVPEQVIGLLIAERRAVERIVAAGLDPAVVRSDVDHLLRHHYR